MTNCNCWKSSIHRSPVYSNGGKCNFSAPIGKKIVIFSLGYLAHVSYDQSKAILTFLEQALLESKHR